MKTMNRLLYRTLSCRTSILTKPLDPVRVLSLWMLCGVGLGTLLCTRFPLLAQRLWLTQGMAVSNAVRTLWDVYCAAALPLLLLLGGLLLCSVSALGQPFALLLLFSRGVAVGLSAADCFLRFQLRRGFLAAGGLVLPFGFLSVLILVFAARDALALSGNMTAYLVRGQADADICAKQHTYLMHLLLRLLLTLLAAGLHTALLWLLNDRLL